MRIDHDPAAVAVFDVPGNEFFLYHIMRDPDAFGGAALVLAPTVMIAAVMAGIAAPVTIAVAGLLARLIDAGDRADHVCLAAGEHAQALEYCQDLARLIPVAGKTRST